MHQSNQNFTTDKFTHNFFKVVHSLLPLSKK